MAIIEGQRQYLAHADLARAIASVEGEAAAALRQPPPVRLVLEDDGLGRCQIVGREATAQQDGAGARASSISSSPRSPVRLSKSARFAGLACLFDSRIIPSNATRGDVMDQSVRSTTGGSTSSGIGQT